jgi:hypothetical protein
MPRDQLHNPDHYVNADRIVDESGRFRHTLADLEDAWAEWSSDIQKIDERALSFLRAAFEAGFEAGNSPQKNRP